MSSRIRGVQNQATLLVLIAILWLWSECVGNLKSNADVSSAESNFLVRMDVRAWLISYQKADLRGREAMLKCWYAQERSYVEILRKCLPEDQAEVKELLADLWRRNRLPSADREAIVRTLVSLSIIECDTGAVAEGRRELVIQAERRFPFPKGTQLEWGYAIAIGARPLRLDLPFGNSRDWEGTGTLTLGSFGGSGYFGTPAGRAILEVQEKVDGKVLWRHTWEVGPTRLKLVLPPQSAQ